MKQLNPDGSITIPSNLPRTRRGPDSRGIRLCFQELGRSCLLQQGYLIFTDGSAYAYDAPSNVEIEALCDSLIRGRVFNFSVRRSRGGFVKGFTPPADYQTIYSFPPYAGSAPTACPIINIDWTQLLWVVVSEVPCGGSVWSWDQNGTQADFQRLGLSNGTFSCHATWETSASLTYSGPAQNSNLHLHQESSHGVFAWGMTVTVTVNGTPVLSVSPSGPPDVDTDYPFTVPDTGGASWVVAVDITYSTNAGFGDINWFAVTTFSDV